MFHRTVLQRRNHLRRTIGVANMNLRDICYARFGWFGRGLSSVLKGTEHDLDAAFFKIHPEVYFSFVGFVAFLSLSVPITVFLLRFTGLIPV